MDESPYVFELLAGLVYLVVGARLLWLSLGTGLAAARLLGINYLCTGASYTLYEILYIVGIESPETTFASRVCYDIGVVPLLIFTHRTFRSDSRWGSHLVWGCSLVLLAGVLFSALGGDLEGYTLGNPWFWFEWVGYTVPYVWLTAEALRVYPAARKRVRFGLCEPLVANRYLLWAAFGAILTAVSVGLVATYREFAVTGLWPAWGDYLVYGAEALATGLLWLVFFPPAWYQRWIEGAAAPATTAEV